MAMNYVEQGATIYCDGQEIVMGQAYAYRSETLPVTDPTYENIRVVGVSWENGLRVWLIPYAACSGRARWMPPNDFLRRFRLLP